MADHVCLKSFECN